MENMKTLQASLVHICHLREAYEMYPHHLRGNLKAYIRPNSSVLHLAIRIRLCITKELCLTILLTTLALSLELATRLICLALPHIQAKSVLQISTLSTKVYGESRACTSPQLLEVSMPDKHMKK